MALFVRNVFVVGAFCAAVVIAAELLLRFLGGSIIPQVVRVENEGYRYAPNLEAIRYNRVDRDLIHIEINEAGVRDDEWAMGKGQFKKIAVIGDSVVAALDTRKTKRFTELLQEKLESDGFRVEVMNAGVNGQNVINYLDMARSILTQYEPDIIVVAVSNGDDFSPRAQATVYNGKLVEYRIGADGLIERTATQLSARQQVVRDFMEFVRPFALVRLSKQLLDNVRNGFSLDFYKDFFSQNDPSPERHQCPRILRLPEDQFELGSRILSDINDLASGRLVLMQFPNALEFPESSVGKSCDWWRLEGWMKSFAGSKMIKHIPLYQHFRDGGGPALYIDGGHLNDAGHEIVAKAMFSELSSRIYAD